MIPRRHLAISDVAVEDRMAVEHLALQASLIYVKRILRIEDAGDRFIPVEPPFNVSKSALVHDARVPDKSAQVEAILDCPQRHAVLIESGREVECGGGSGHVRVERRGVIAYEFYDALSDGCFAELISTLND